MEFDTFSRSYTLLFNLDESSRQPFSMWINRQKTRGVVVVTPFVFAGNCIVAGAYRLTKFQGWVDPEWYSPFTAEVTYAWASDTAAENAVDLKSSLDAYAGTPDDRGYSTWWEDEGDNVLDDFDPHDRYESAPTGSASVDAANKPKTTFNWSMV